MKRTACQVRRHAEGVCSKDALPVNRAKVVVLIPSPWAGALQGFQRSRLRAKAADVIGLYLKPPAHAAMFDVDEKTASKRSIASTLRSLSPRRIERHGTLSLYAAFNTKTRRGPEQACSAAHRARNSWLSFVTSSPISLGAKRSASSATTSRRTRPRASTLSLPSIRTRILHSIPTYSSWLNQVELWFSKIERDVIARGVFTSVADLNSGSTEPRPFALRIRALQSTGRPR